MCTDPVMEMKEYTAMCSSGRVEVKPADTVRIKECGYGAVKECTTTLL